MQFLCAVPVVEFELDSYRGGIQPIRTCAHKFDHFDTPWTILVGATREEGDVAAVIDEISSVRKLEAEGVDECVFSWLNVCFQNFIDPEFIF